MCPDPRSPHPAGNCQFGTPGGPTQTGYPRRAGSDPGPLGKRLGILRRFPDVLYQARQPPAATDPQCRTGPAGADQGRGDADPHQRRCQWRMRVRCVRVQAEQIAVPSGTPAASVQARSSRGPGQPLRWNRLDRATCPLRGDLDQAGLDRRSAPAGCPRRYGRFPASGRIRRSSPPVPPPATAGRPPPTAGRPATSAHRRGRSGRPPRAAPSDRIPRAAPIQRRRTTAGSRVDSRRRQNTPGGRHRPGCSVIRVRRCSDCANARGLRALGALADLELHRWFSSRVRKPDPWISV